MINTQDYTTKEFTPAQSVHASKPQGRLRKPKSVKYSHEVILDSNELDFLSDFIKVTAFYIEDLEDYLGEELLDFWQSREYALKIITDAMMDRAECRR